MFTTNRYAPASSNPLGKLHHVEAPGVQRFSAQLYQGYRVQISRRKLGQTIKRSLYSATIEAPDGRQPIFLSDLTSVDAARQAAHRWIDLHPLIDKDAATLAWEQMLETAQARRQQLRAVELGADEV